MITNTTVRDEWITTARGYITRARNAREQYTYVGAEAAAFYLRMAAHARAHAATLPRRAVTS